MDDPAVPINSVKRSYRVVDAIRERGRAGVTELAAALDLPKSTVHNHLRTLERLGYLVEDGGRYRLGVEYLRLGRESRNSREVFVHGREAVNRLQERTDAHALLVVEENGMGAILLATRWEYGDLPPTARHVYPTHEHLHSNAPGKAILAHLPDERVDEIAERHGLPARTNRTVTDVDALREELEAVRRRGYAVDWGELIEGMVGVAAPIVTGERVHGALAAYGPTAEIQPGIAAGELTSTVAEMADTVRADIVFADSDYSD
ncbi:IclR family transcriptional regulator [Halomarina pelagica]|uniref:IclR family transcriptional regulator n=1 Tax=Halomarina pelagica TaxID=2961599 RepID=UPI0020C41DF5|nr:IclR family transcriptional regulator [Halomarina sp. BND7]